MRLAKIFKIFSITLLSLSFVSAWIMPVIASEERLNDNDQFVGVIIELTNAERVTGSEKLLVKNERLMKAAQMKAESMARESYFSHTSPKGINPWHWFYEAGYKPRLAGENLGLTYSKTPRLVDAWMKSPTHKKNILKERYEEIGIGVAKGIYNGREVYFTVQLFGLE